MYTASEMHRGAPITDAQLLAVAKKYQLAAAMYVAEWFEEHEG